MNIEIIDAMDAETKRRLLDERVEVVAYDPVWVAHFEEEKQFLTQTFPDIFCGRIEHFGSTSIPGVAAKPIIDMLVEVNDFARVKSEAHPVLTSRGYDYIWKPSATDPEVFYPFFIKRGHDGKRTHHIHIVKNDFENWNRLRFRDYLKSNLGAAIEYSELKLELATRHSNDRMAYLSAKSEFVERINKLAEATLNNIGS